MQHKIMPRQIKPHEVIEMENVKQLLENVAGESAFDLTKCCVKNKEMLTDEEMAKKTKIKLTKIRTLLNRLHYRGIAEYDKTRDNKTGWYTYKWDIKTKRIAELLLEQHMERKEKLDQKQVIENNYMMFSCKKGCERMPFEVAAEYEFKCPECGDKLNDLNGTTNPKEGKKELTRLEEEIQKLKLHLKT